MSSPPMVTFIFFIFLCLGVNNASILMTGVVPSNRDHYLFNTQHSHSKLSWHPGAVDILGLYVLFLIFDVVTLFMLVLFLES